MCVQVCRLVQHVGKLANCHNPCSHMSQCIHFIRAYCFAIQGAETPSAQQTQWRWTVPVSLPLIALECTISILALLFHGMGLEGLFPVHLTVRNALCNNYHNHLHAFPVSQRMGFLLFQLVYKPLRRLGEKINPHRRTWPLSVPRSRAKPNEAAFSYYISSPVEHPMTTSWTHEVWGWNCCLI